MNRYPPGKGKGRPKGGKGGKGGKPRPGRRTPPPPGTGEESRYLNGLMESGTPLVLVLANGEKGRGTLEEVDRDQITLKAPHGSMVIRKQDIRYIYESEDD